MEDISTIEELNTENRELAAIKVEYIMKKQEPAKAYEILCNSDISGNQQLEEMKKRLELEIIGESVTLAKDELSNIKIFTEAVCEHEWSTECTELVLELDEAVDSGLDFVFTASGYFDENSEHDQLKVESTGFGIKITGDDELAWKKTISEDFGEIYYTYSEYGADYDCEIDLEIAEKELEKLFIKVYDLFTKIKKEDLSFVEKKREMKEEISKKRNEREKLEQEIYRLTRKLSELEKRAFDEMYGKY